ncbi:MAG: hypothetical protein MRY32_06450 [Rickettsiales bacterium]|nr:hypothetical protein [Rickettsiales bacterium]
MTVETPEYTMQELEQSYYEITDLYDLADELIATVDPEIVDNPAEQLAIVQPLAEEVGDAADILAEEFIAIAENNGQGQAQNRTKIEGALRKIFSAIDAYNVRVNAEVHDAAQGIRNVADTIVKKLKRQIEVVVATLIDFVELSLDRIMQRSHVEEMKRHQEKIALMIHQATQHQPG